MKQYLSRSIRWQLLAWQMVLLAAVLVVLLSLHYHLKHNSLIADADAMLQDAISLALPAIAPMTGGPPPGAHPFGGRIGNTPPPGGPLPSLEENEDFQELIEEKNLYLMAWDPEGLSQNKIGNFPKASMAEYTNNKKEGRQFIMRHGARELATAHPSGFLIVIGLPMAGIEKELAATRAGLFVVGTAVFLIGLVGGSIIIHRTLEPIRKISRTAEEIAAGDHSRRIELAAAPAELAGLAQTLNNSFNHLDNALEAQIRFSADASHELRTPIAVVMAQTQAALRRDRSTEEYKTILDACLRAAQRMKTMADSLLELTRISTNGRVLNKSLTRLSEVVSGAVEEATNLSEKHPVSFHTLEKPLFVQIDADRIHQVLMNLISNAIKHNPDGCTVRISQKASDEWAIIEITDEGSGIPADALPHLFERFYRVDQSRSRESGGSGLGLSIVESIIETHGGSIEASSILGQSTTFTIKLPLNLT